MQLALDIELHLDFTFDTYSWAGNELLERQVKLALANQNDEQFFYIYGPKGCGKSHLLQAIVNNHDKGAHYIPLKQAKHYGADALLGLENGSLVCLDDLDAITADKSFEIALFHQYNQLRDSGRQKLFITGSRPLTNTNINLADLSSRLSWGLVFQLYELDDGEKARVLIAKAKQKGLQLPEKVAQYLISHCARDMHYLQATIDTLDKASLAAQRKLTIPFVKQILSTPPQATDTPFL
jgi:DnaA-homolog protein